MRKQNVAFTHNGDMYIPDAGRAKQHKNGMGGVTYDRI